MISPNPPWWSSHPPVERGSREEVIETINGGFSDVSSVAWVHCCANIDWSLLTDADIDVINFDAYMYWDKIALYAKEFNRFLEKGGTIAWGIVPVADDLLSKESVQSLVEKLERGSTCSCRTASTKSSWQVPPGCCRAARPYC